MFIKIDTEMHVKVERNIDLFFSDPKGFNDTKLPNGGFNIFAVLLHTHLAGNLNNKLTVKNVDYFIIKVAHAFYSFGPLIRRKHGN